MKKEYRMSKLNGTARIFQYTIPLPNFSFSIFYFDFYFHPPEIQFITATDGSIKYIQNNITFFDVITYGKRNKYIFFIGDNKFV